jgi:hypothetical protein
MSLTIASGSNLGQILAAASALRPGKPAQVHYLA